MDIETIKNELKEHILDSVQEDAYTAALQESAGKETGWNKFRDQCFLPTLIDGGLWLTGKLLGKMSAVQE